jgi:predicted nucleotidyltransferase
MDKKQINKPSFPTQLHQDAAELVGDYFFKISAIDTVLVVNSCARGQAVPESDLDFAVLVKPDISAAEIKSIEDAWQLYQQSEPTIIKYKRSGPFAHLHLDVIDGHYTPGDMGEGEPIDYFEIEIGNQICYSAPMGITGSYFHELQTKWLPYYNEELRMQRLRMVTEACSYDLDHIPFFVKRELYFQAFEILYKAFQEFLQTLFIANKTYPIAYNKWIGEQVIKWLNKPALYPKLAPILSISNIESPQINEKANDLRKLLKDLG